MKRLNINVNDGGVGFQIAPMIDVVFVIMLFFMVMANTVKKEMNLNTKLPGVVTTDQPMDFVDEQIISIASNGQVSLNDDFVDDENNPDLPQLQRTLMRLKEASDSAKSKLLITIISDPQAKYRRTINVLDVLAACQISSVTFTVSDDSQ